jgi:hypothetical protein
MAKKVSSLLNNNTLAESNVTAWNYSLFQSLQFPTKTSVMNCGSFWSISALGTVAAALPQASSSGEATTHMFLNWLTQIMRPRVGNKYAVFKV